MKLLISSLFLFALATAAYGLSSNWGSRSHYDTLLSRDLVKRVAQRNNYWNINIDFPRGGIANKRAISAIYVIDNFRNQSGAYPTLRSGGPGWSYCSVNLRGNYNQGVDSTVEIWGRR